MASIGVFQTFGRIAGENGGVALLVLMAALKLLEMKSQRDVILCIYLLLPLWTNSSSRRASSSHLHGPVRVDLRGDLVGFTECGGPARGALRPAASLLVQALR